MARVIIVRYGELALKGANRKDFEKKLVRNIKDCMKRNNADFVSVSRIRGRIYIESSSVCEQLSNVFGIVSWSPAVKIKYSLESVKSVADELLSGVDFQTFRISAHRINKKVKDNSNKINIELGRHIVDTYKKKVQLKGFNIDIGVEIYGDDAYVYVSRFQGPGGLPYGINGKALAFVDDERDQLAAWMIMKRGVRVYPVADNAEKIYLIAKYDYGAPMNLGAIDSDVIITGQTLENLEEVKGAALHLRPLVGFSQAEIEEKIKSL